jgi:phenylacetic acid degradation protein
MHAVIEDNAEIGESAFFGALAFVKAGMKVPPRTPVAGIPARIVRELTEKEFAPHLQCGRACISLLAQQHHRDCRQVSDEHQRRKIDR